MVWRLFLAMLIVSGLAPAASAPRDRSASRAAIEAQYRRMAAAIEKGSAASLGMLLAPGFALTAEGVSLSRQRYLKMVAQGLRLVRQVKVRASMESFADRGERAVVFSRQEHSGVIRSPRDKRLHRVTTEMRMRDTWVKSPGGWKLLKTEGLTNRSRMDPKPLPEP